MNSKSTKFSHVEINVLDYANAIRFYDKVLPPIGLVRLSCMKDWTAYSDGGTKLIICPTNEKFKDVGYHRKRAGVNHLAFYADSKQEVDHFFETVLRPNQIDALYEGRPFGDENYYAVFFEGPDRIKLELVYAPTYCDPKSWPNTFKDEFDPYLTEPS